ncbi:MAG TPA: response regulator [Candidatus Nitrosotalea sp.]|nr:response regulator [Candidatus Nitrosotalea sp.]
MIDVGKVSKKGCTAIVIDDDEDTVNLFSEFLEICDIKVLGKAYEGNQAVEMYKKIFPDLVFSDVMMPGYDGFYVLQKIRQINPHSIMVMITGDVRPETIDELQKLKADAIVYKPFDMKQVIETVNELLKKSVYQTQIN